MNYVQCFIFFIVLIIPRIQGTPTKLDELKININIIERRAKIKDIKIDSNSDYLERCKGKDNGCCTKETPCAKNEGDCDKDHDCMGGLVCGSNNCDWDDNDDCCTSNHNEFYVIQHMANNENAVNWAINNGANGLEIDVQFDRVTGKLNKFYHGGFCDCTCIKGVYEKKNIKLFTDSNICNKIDCEVESNPERLLQIVAQKSPMLALVWIDGKFDGNADMNTKKKAGNEVINMITTNLFGNGFSGKVLIDSQEKEYIRAASEAAKMSTAPLNKIYFAYWGPAFEEKIKFLKSLSLPDNIMYSVGRSSCYTDTFVGYETLLKQLGREREHKSEEQILDEARKAENLRKNGVIQNNILWTLDKINDIQKLYDAGVRAFLTNDVKTLVNWAQEKGIKLATN